MSRTNRTRAYTVRYNDDEDKLVMAAADANSLEVGSWIRMITVQAAKRAKLDSVPARPRTRRPT